MVGIQFTTSVLFTLFMKVADFNFVSLVLDLMMSNCLGGLPSASYILILLQNIITSFFGMRTLELTISIQNSKLAAICLMKNKTKHMMFLFKYSE